MVCRFRIYGSDTAAAIANFAYLSALFIAQLDYSHCLGPGNFKFHFCTIL